MALRLKGSVSINKLQPQMLVALIAASVQFEQVGKDCWITSGNDGRHMSGSRHYSGLALDFRINHLSKEQLKSVHENLKLHLSPLFDVVLEPTHIHIEYDPK